jgi:hypothetical protein
MILNIKSHKKETLPSLGHKTISKTTKGQTWLQV